MNEASILTPSFFSLWTLSLCWSHLFKIKLVILIFENDDYEKPPLDEAATEEADDDKMKEVVLAHIIW